MAASFHRLIAAAAVGAVLLVAAMAADAKADNAGQIGALGEQGAEPGKFVFPNIIGAEPAGSVYVGDQPEGFSSLRIQKFSATGGLEGSVTIPTPNEEVFQGIAVDPVKGRFYVLRDREGSDPATGRAPAETILVFSTTPDPSGKLVPPASGSGPQELPVPQGEGSIDDPTELALDPQNGDLQILGTNRAGLPVLQRIGTGGSGSIGARYDETTNPPGIPSFPEIAFAFGPDGATYLLGTRREPNEHHLYRLSPDLTGTLTEIPGFATAEGRQPIIAGVASGFPGHGAQIAVSANGESLFYKEELAFTGSEEPGSFLIHGYSLVDGSATALFGGGSAELQCTIQTQSAGLAVAGEGLLVLDQGPNGEAGPIFGNHVLRFGPGGSGCPAPSAAATLSVPAGEVVSAPPGTSVTLDGRGSELGQWGEKFEAATWVVEGPEARFEQTVTSGLTLQHTFNAPGEYTVRLRVKAKLKRTTPELEPTVYGAPPQTLTVAPGGIVTRPAVTGLAPASGPAAGGNTVTIYGSSLGGVREVKFGDATATEVQALDDDTVTATAPAGAVGAVVDVSVTTAAGSSARKSVDRYTYEAGGPGGSGGSVTAVSPATGPAAGGNLVTITGTGLDGATGVTFGSAAATSVTPVDSQTVTAVAPRGAPGTVVDVTVATPLGTTAFGAADRYKYEALSQELSVSKLGNGSGTVASTRAGISCGTGCSASFPQAATVVLLASPAAGSTFAGWGGACSGQGLCVVGMTAAKSVTADFEAPAQLLAAGGRVPSTTSPGTKSPPGGARCKPGKKPKKVGGKIRCVEKKHGNGGKHGRHKKHSRHKRRATRGQGGKHASKGR